MKDKTAEQGFSINGTTIAPGVVETIISLAAGEVAGVAGVGTAGPINAIVAAFNAGKAVPSTGIKLQTEDDGTVSVNITIQAYYGYRIADVADNVRAAVADALKGQIGAEVDHVDVYVDALASEE